MASMSDYQSSQKSKQCITGFGNTTGRDFATPLIT